MNTTGRIKTSALLVGIALVGIVSCDRDIEPKETLAPPSTEYVTTSEYNAMVSAKNAVEDTLYQTINEIDNNLKLIRANQGLLTVTDAEKGKFSKKAEILKTLTEINSLLDQNREKIKKLNKQVASLRGQRMEWKKETDELRKLISEKEQEMMVLQQQLYEQTGTINYLNQTVNELKVAHGSELDKAQKMDMELHKAYYAMGSFKELKERNVLEKKGGVLGLGRTAALKPDFEKEYFTEIDTRQVTTIPVNSKKAKLVTHHPVGSYEWEKTGEKGNTEYLTITDPGKFWATSKYLVVEVK